MEMAYTPNTLIAYKQDQSSFLNLTGKNLLEALPLDILVYKKELLLNGYASSTILRRLNSISKQFSLLVLWGLRVDNPFKILKTFTKNLIPKQVRRIHQPLTTEDIFCIKQLNNNKVALLIELLYSTGGRISEILDIKKQDLKPYDEAVSKVEIIGKGNKSRLLFIENRLIDCISKNFTSVSEYLIHTERGNRSNRSSEYKKIKALLIKVTGKNAHPHQLRHLYATTQIIKRKKSVKAVSKYLGHSTTAITLDMYVDDELTSKNAVLK